MRREDCDKENAPNPGYSDQSPMPMGMHESSCERPTTMERKRELMTLALGLAGQVKATTKRHERCLLRQMVEMFLDD